MIISSWRLNFSTASNVAPVSGISSVSYIEKIANGEQSQLDCIHTHVLLATGSVE